MISVWESSENRYSLIHSLVNGTTLQRGFVLQLLNWNNVDKFVFVPCVFMSVYVAYEEFISGVLLMN